MQKSNWAMPILIGLFLTASALANPLCEGALTGRSFMSLINKALLDGEIDLQDLDQLVQVNTPQDPLKSKRTTVSNAALKSGFAQIIASKEVQENWPSVQRELRNLIEISRQNAESTESAKKRTEEIFAPKLIHQHTIPGASSVSIFGNAQGELFAGSVNYDFATASTPGIYPGTKKQKMQQKLQLWTLSILNLVTGQRATAGIEDSGYNLDSFNLDQQGQPVLTHINNKGRLGIFRGWNLEHVSNLQISKQLRQSCGQHEVRSLGSYLLPNGKLLKIARPNGKGDYGPLVLFALKDNHFRESWISLDARNLKVAQAPDGSVILTFLDMGNDGENGRFRILSFGQDRGEKLIYLSKREDQTTHLESFVTKDGRVLVTRKSPASRSVEFFEVVSKKELKFLFQIPRGRGSAAEANERWFENGKGQIYYVVELGSETIAVNVNEQKELFRLKLGPDHNFQWIEDASGDVKLIAVNPKLDVRYKLLSINPYHPVLQEVDLPVMVSPLGLMLKMHVLKDSQGSPLLVGAVDERVYVFKLFSPANR